jgi:hypothetical protein
MLVSRNFVVPDYDIRWPEEMRDMNLGTVVNRIRQGKFYVDKRADLESVGFDYNRQENGYGYEAIKAAFLKYKYIYGNMLVPSRFVVPADDIRWPEEMWGMKLGGVVNNIRCGKSYADKREEFFCIV